MVREAIGVAPPGWERMLFACCAKDSKAKNEEDQEATAIETGTKNVVVFSEQKRISSPDPSLGDEADEDGAEDGAILTRRHPCRVEEYGGQDEVAGREVANARYCTSE